MIEENELPKVLFFGKTRANMGKYVFSMHEKKNTFKKEVY